MRGLVLFISDIRKCRGKEDEMKRINKELANIRSKFKGNKTISGYHKKKYVCKLLFMFLLGHKCDFGYLEAVNLLSSNAYSEKQIGYLFISVVMGMNHTYALLVNNAVKNDLSSSNKIFQNLALQFISNNATKDMSECLTDSVLSIVLSNETAEFVKQTAILTLLQLLRFKTNLDFDKQVSDRLINLLSSSNLGIVTAAASLLDFLAKDSPSQYEPCISHAISRLSRSASCAVIDVKDYVHNYVTAPWISVKLLKLLQNFNMPTEVNMKVRLIECLNLILRKTQDPPKTKRIEHNNSKYAIIFEAISLIIHMEFGGCLLSKAIGILGNSLKQKDSNLRCMALEIMAQLSNNDIARHVVMLHWESVLETLRTESDSSIKKCAADLLFNICESCNVKEIVEEMMYFIQTEDKTTQEEVVLKIAALAGRFLTDLQWYVDTILNMVHICADNVRDSVWFVLIKVIIDNHDVQEYAARAAYAILDRGDSHDKIVKVSGYILGEFGYLIAKDPRCGHLKQLGILHEKFFACSSTTKAHLLNTFMKFINLYPDLRTRIQSILRDNRNIRSTDEEVQQRAVEYLKLSEIASSSLLATVLDGMPSCARQGTAILKNLERKKYKFVRNFPQTKGSSQKMLASSYSVCDINRVAECLIHSESQPVRSVSHSNMRSGNHYSNLDILVDIFSETSINPMESTPEVMPFRSIKMLPTNEKFLQYLLFNATGILFEDDTINIHLQSEFAKTFGRFHLVYSNTSNHFLYDFTVTGNFINTENKCSIWFKPNTSMLSIGHSMEQDIHIECLKEFTARPSLTLRFNTSKGKQEIKLILPLTLNKFVEPCVMSAEVFVKRWENLCNEGQGFARVFTAKFPMLYGVARLKLKGFRLAVIENADPNPENFTCAGIFYSRASRIGLLVRLERRPQENKYRAVVRSNQYTVSETICMLLAELF